MAVAVCLTMTACEKPITAEIENVNESEWGGVDSNIPTKKFTFTMKGDFGSPSFDDDESQNSSRRASYLQADGRDMTDVWVLDYVDGVLVQQVHQEDNTAEDFGKPVMQLAYGSHHVYFIASRGTNPTLNTTGGTVTWERPSDTFYKDYAVDVVATSNGNRAVTLERVATKLKLTIEDEVPAGCTEVAVTPDVWYYGWDYVHGAAVDQQQKERVVSVPSSLVGTAGQLAVTIYGLSNVTEWMTNVSVSGRTSTQSVIGSASIVGAPFKANRTTEYSGNLFGSGGLINVGLNSTWTTSHVGSW